MGMAWLCDGDPVIVNAQGLTERERDLTILHELAHCLFDGDATGANLHSREQWREERADRWAEETLELLEI
jgi:Zn-dependent peptidase ImmA (M78 family)